MRRAAAALLLAAACARGPDVPVPPASSVTDETLAAALRADADRVRAAPDDPVAWAALAMRYDANWFDDLAAACYRRALAARPGEPKWWYGLAFVLERTQRYDEAVAAAARALESAPDYPPLHRSLALWALARGRLDDAEESARRALEVSDGGAGAWIALGRVQMERGADGPAAESFGEAVRRWPPDWGPATYAHFLLGNALRRLGRTEEATRELALGRHAVPQLPDPWRGEVMALREGFDARVERAHRLVMADRFEEAERELTELRRARPTHEQVLTELGTLYLLTSRWKEAIAALEECVDAHPAALDPRLQLARGLWATGRRDEALRHTQAAVQSNPDSADAYEARGMFRLRASRPDDALADFDTAARLDPTSASARAFAGAANLVLERIDAAAAAFEAATRVDPSQTTAVAGLAIVAVKRGDLARADALLAQIAHVPEQGAPLVAEARQNRAAAGR
jgi:tetratricopeptide (TPR) repeat protein